MTESGVSESVGGKSLYGWVVVATGALLMGANAAVVNSFSVFFKPLSADFGWSRATTAGIQSTLYISLAVFSIIFGYLADRFGRTRLFAFCGLMAGLGLVLTSRITSLWQIYLSYGVIVAMGLCVTFSMTGTATVRWFTRRRGLALGIVTSGVGLGTTFGVPAVARLIDAVGWSRTYVILGLAAFVIIEIGALLLRRNPGKETYPLEEAQPRLGEPATVPAVKVGATAGGPTIREALNARTFWTILSIFFLFSVCNQLIAVHVVNYATDIGFAPLVAATIASAIGVGSLSGRILMGGASDRIGNLNTLVIGATGIALSMVWLNFARELWMLYLFAAVFGFNFGAEVPQQAVLMGKYFGFRILFVGISHASANVGGAVGSWIGGKVFDVTQSYQLAFLVGIVTIGGALAATLSLARQSKGRMAVKSS